MLQEYTRILVAVDGSEQAKKAFTKAIEVAKRNHAVLVLAHVIDTREYQSFSTFAGNPYFIDPEDLIARGYLTEEECDAYDFEKGDLLAINSFRGEYMVNYSWAEFTTGHYVTLNERINKS